MDNTQIRVCKKCLLSKPITEFTFYTKIVGAYRSGTCRICENAYRSNFKRVKRREKNKILALREELLLQGVGYCGRCETQKPIIEFTLSRNKAGYTGTCKRCTSELNKFAKVRQAYGLTKDNYELILEKQNYSCAVCNHSFMNGKVCVDHDHTTGEVRGLLCDSCNRGIGLLRDNTLILQNAINYLNSPHKIPLNGETPEVDNPVLTPLVIRENA